MTQNNISQELVDVFKDFGDDEYRGYDADASIVYCMLRSEYSTAHQAVVSITNKPNSDELCYLYKSIVDEQQEEGNFDVNPTVLFESYLKESEKLRKKYKKRCITSVMLLSTILQKNPEVASVFLEYGINTDKLNDFIMESENQEIGEVENIKKKNTTIALDKQPQKTKPKQTIADTNEGYIINLNVLEREKKPIKDDNPIYQKIFTSLSKKRNNNVILIGKDGVGKTTLIHKLANLITNGNCPPSFKKKTVALIDFSKLVIGTTLRGAFEQKFHNLIVNAPMRGDFIFVIDNLDKLLEGNTRYSETDMDTLLATMFNNPSMQVICVSNDDVYYEDLSDSVLSNYWDVIEVEEPSIEKTIEILNEIKQDYEDFHSVKYTQKSIEDCVKYAEQYITDKNLPDSAIDVMDITGANINIKSKQDNILSDIQKEILSLEEELNNLKNNSKIKEYDKIDNITNNIIKLKSKMRTREKELALGNNHREVTSDDVREALSAYIDADITIADIDEKKRLKALSSELKSIVIGQDEAVDEVCRVVKRQRIGLGESERPAVLMFLGSTGTGKTYLTKKLAEKLYGDETDMVRLDMSEYSDETSINKIVGSPAGYVGYSDDTVLIKALKTKSKFILLLDEFEKCNEKIHSVFLQMFDDGRFTDNHGETYSLKDVIIVLTSNVGAQESSQRSCIGFNTGNQAEFTNDIIKKALQRKFKPEFLNRIQSFVYFNKLNDENIKSIIKIEIGKVAKKVEKQNFYLDSDITDGIMVDKIFDLIKDKRDFGARPIVNEIQRNIEDKIVDYIIDDEVEEGHKFTMNEIL